LTRLFAWLILMVALLLLAAYVILLAMGCTVSPLGDLPVMMSGQAFAFLSFLIIRYRPENRIGWLAAVIGLSFAFNSAATHYAACNLAGVASLPAEAAVAWLGNLTSIVGVSALFAGLPLLFPDGRFLSRGWRRFSLTFFGLLALLAFLLFTLRVSVFGGDLPPYDYENPFALSLLPESAGPALAPMLLVLFMIGGIGAIISLIQRWRRSTGDTRQQLKWFAYFLATAVAVQLLVFELPKAFILEQLQLSVPFNIAYALILFMVFLGFPLTIGMAIFRYRLYEIDVIIRKTLVYSVLTGLLVLLWLGTVIALQALLGSYVGEQSPVVIVVSTLVIAALAGALHRRVQQIIDRRFYRRRYDAQLVLDQFARTARDEVSLEALSAEVTRVVQETLQPEVVNVWLREG